MSRSQKLDGFQPFNYMLFSNSLYDLTLYKAQPTDKFVAITKNVQNLHKP